MAEVAPQEPNYLAIIFYKQAFLGLVFFICVFSGLQLKDNYVPTQIKSLPKLGFEPRISGVGSDRSANCATTTARGLNIF